MPVATEKVIEYPLFMQNDKFMESISKLFKFVKL